MLYLTIPAKNEAPYIQDTIRRLHKSLAELECPWRLVVVENGSDDNTAEIVLAMQSDPRYANKLQLLSCAITGKGAAIIHSANELSSAEGSLFGFIDADLSADPDAIPSMIKRIESGSADIVIASRLLITKTTNRSLVRTLSSQAFNLFAGSMLRLKVKDAQCGLKIMNQKALNVLRTCKEQGWFLDIEFLAKARQYGLRVAEVPVPWIEFRYPLRKSHIRHIRDGLSAISAIYKIRQRIYKK